jgi:cyclophilin family peptidyl-prolyl cis-trans isomerase
MKRIVALVGLFLGLSASQAGTAVQLRTVFGDLEVELYDQQRPVTVSNFLHYVSIGSYSNTFFHRLVPGFVVQGGGFTVADPGTPDAAVYDVPVGPSITNEFRIGPLLSNLAGTLAMAKTSDPNSANSQFFINLADNSASLDSTNNSGGFTVFGRVIGGTNLLSAFNGFIRLGSLPKGRPATNIVVDLNPALNGVNFGPFGEIPLLRLNTNFVVINTNFPAVGTNLQPQLFFDPTNFLFVDISTLNVHVRPRPIGDHVISWQSVVNATNTVEYTTKFPPSWQVLTNLVRPPPGTNQIVDTAMDSRRFYRVRITY